MKLTNKEKELLSFTSKTTMGMIAVSNPETDNIAYRLCRKGLMKRHETKLPFCGSVSYWSLTERGWEIMGS